MCEGERRRPTCQKWLTLATDFRRHVRPFFLDAITGNPSSKKMYYDAISFVATQLVFSFATTPFLVLAFGDSVLAWSRVFFYGAVGTVLCLAFFASPGKAMLKKQLERRQGKASAKLVRSVSTDSLTGKEPILGISKDIELDVAEAMQELRGEIEEKRKKQASERRK